jgi:hypothetical protein
MLECSASFNANAAHDAKGPMALAVVGLKEER